MNILHKLVLVLDDLVLSQTNFKSGAVEEIVGNSDAEYFLRLHRFERPSA